MEQTEQTLLLVPLDGSPFAEAALPYAEAIAEAKRGLLRLVSVVEPAPVGPAGEPSAVQAHLEQVERQRLGRYLAATADALQSRGRAVAVTLELGDPARRILAMAEEHDAAMIVMATHGRGGAARWLVGSVADKVMRLSTCPTLLVRPPEAGVPARPVRLRRLMVPLDGSPLAEIALPLASDLAVATGATLTLVRVVPWLSSVTAADGGTYDFSTVDDGIVAAAEAEVERSRRSIPTGIKTEGMVLRGAAGPALIGFALQEHVDLVVMSTHGRSGLPRFVLGSIADRIVRCGVPAVLVHPTPDHPSPAPGTRSGPAHAEVR